VLNSLALKFARISKETPDPAGGLIDRDITTGEPTGLLYGMGDLLAGVIPSVDNGQVEHGIRLANRELLASGITSVQDASPHNHIEQWRMFEHWKASGLLTPRVNMMLGFAGFAERGRYNFATPMDEHQLCIRGVKIP
jgi:predicted amidohydrolase YtcJ